MRLMLCILLAFSLPAFADAAGNAVDAVLRANQLAVGHMPQAGSAVYRYGYAGAGLTGEEARTQDLATDRKSVV